jgi:hypothetical protein
MSQFLHVVGHVIDTQKRYQSYGGGISPTLHQEIWIKDQNGVETHIHLVDEEDVPLRKGHLIRIVFFEGRPVGLINFSTNKYINFEPYAYIPPDDLLPKFPNILNFRDLGIVVFSLIAVGVAFERHPLIAFVIFLAVTGVVIYRLRHKPSVVQSGFHDDVETEIKSALLERNASQ